MSTDSPAQVPVCEEAKPPPQPAPVAARGTSCKTLLLASFLGAFLLWLSYFPVNAGWLAWVALVPFLYLARSPLRARWVYPAAWLFGLLFYFAAVHWLSYADDRELFTLSIPKLELGPYERAPEKIHNVPPEPDGFPVRVGYLTWTSLAVYCAFYVPLAVFLLRRLDRRTTLPLCLTLPAVWTALEFARAHVLTGFPWYFLGHTQHGFLPLIQVADLGGAYLVSFLVAAVNGLLFDLLSRQQWFQTWLSPRPHTDCATLRTQGIVVGVLLTAALGYGFIRLSQEDFQEGPRVALIQGNLPQSLRNMASADEATRNAAQETSEAHFNRLADRAAEGHPDLIVWPETSAPFPWDVTPRGDPDGYSSSKAREAIVRWRTNLLLGTNSYNQREEGPSTSYNSAILLTPNDPIFAGRYDKIHRVPFGEYVPMKDTFSFMNILAPYDFDYSIRPGEELKRFPLGPYRFGVLICFEDSDAYLARRYVTGSAPFLDRVNSFLTGHMYGTLPPPADDRPVDFLVNLSNDAWFNGSSEHDEHLAVSRFRAVECRRSVARAVNMGISAVIDGSGRVVALPAETWAASKKIDAVVTHAIPLDHRRSLYALLGDWLPVLCLAVVIGGIVRRRRA